MKSQSPASSLAKKRALIVVDMSVEQMAAVEYKAQEVLQNCRALALNENGFFDVCIDCKLWLETEQESSLSWVWPETAQTMFRAGTEGAKLVPELRSLSNLVFVPKNNYSCFAKSSLSHVLEEHRVGEVYICGINTDYCVFATAMGAFERMYRTYVVEDAVTSVRGRAAHNEGLQNLVRHFSPEVLVETKHITG